MYSIADNNCNPIAGSVPLDQVAQDLSNRGLTATGVVVVDRTQTAGRLCYGGSLYPTWSDLDTLRDTYGWSFDSDGMSHNDITAMTTAQQYEESCGSLAYLAENGMRTADAFYAYGDNLRSTPIQTNTVSQCFDYGRTYNGGVNTRAGLTAPYFQKTNSLLGGACNDFDPVLLHAQHQRQALRVAGRDAIAAAGHRRSVGRASVLSDGHRCKREHESVMGLHEPQLAGPLDKPDRDVLHERLRPGDQHDPGRSRGDQPGDGRRGMGTPGVECRGPGDGAEHRLARCRRDRDVERRQRDD